MICARCDQPIEDGERFVTVHHTSPTGPGTSLVVHEERCQPVPQQTYPTLRRSM
jgi:hypothetical protein